MAGVGRPGRYGSPSRGPIWDLAISDSVWGLSNSKAKGYTGGPGLRTEGHLTQRQSHAVWGTRGSLASPR